MRVDWLLSSFGRDAIIKQLVNEVCPYQEWFRMVIVYRLIGAVELIQNTTSSSCWEVLIPEASIRC